MVGLLAAVRDEHGVVLPELDLGGGQGIAYTARRRPDGRRASTPRAARRSCARECAAPGCRCRGWRSSPAARSSGPTTVTLYEVGTVKELPGLRTYVSVDGGMSDNIRTALYDAPLHRGARLAAPRGAGRAP